VRIAHIALADRYAAPTLAKAEQQLRSAEEVYGRKSDKKAVIAAAREVVQTAEESRVMAVKQKPRKTPKPESPRKESRRGSRS